MPVKLSDRGIRLLNELLSEEALQSELDLIRQMASEIGSRMAQITDFFTAIEAQRLVDNMIEELPAGPWTNKSATLAVTQLVQAVELVPIVRQHIAEGRILERAMLWESANSHLTVYRWYTEVGPTLARVLFDAHRQGSEVLTTRYPLFEPLVDHIFRYVQCVFVNKTAAKESKAQRRASRTHPQQDMPASNTLSALNKVPANLYGLLPVENTKPVKLPSVTSYRLSADLDNQYCHAIDVFLTLFSDRIIAENMKDADNKINSGRRRSGDDHTMIRLRCINRGALLTCIVEAFKDEDGIFAFPPIERLLTSPSLLFSEPIRKDADLSARIIANPTGALNCVNEYVTQLLSKSPSITSIAKEIGDTVFEAASTLNSRPTSKRSLPSQVRKSHRPFKSTSDSVPVGPVCLETLLGEDGAPFFGQPALMIREVLNFRRGHEVGDEMLNRVLQGLTPTTGGVILDDGKDGDHFMPLRWDNNYARLLMKHLPPSVLVTPLGFSSLLVWMATGQGNLTTEFIESNVMNFGSLDEAVATFQRAHDQNALGHTIAFDNMKVWGQSAKALSFKAKKGMTIREKLAPFFEKDVQDAWMKELGPELAYHPNPKSYTGKRPTFTDITSFAKKHKLLGLMDGLTQLQFANNLVLAGIVTPPTVDEIAPWIAKHPRLGAYGGLKAMGFRIAPNNVGEPWVRAAFQCIYDHFDLHLSPEDKVELDFGVIFVEHILCKLVRWQGRFKAANIGVDLTSMAQKASSPWVSGKNREDSTGQLMPVPMTASKEQLGRSIAKALVSSPTILGIFPS